MVKTLVEELRERLKLKYMGNCKCGDCQLVEDWLIVDVINYIEYLEKENIPR